MDQNSRQSAACAATIEARLRTKWADLLGVEGHDVTGHSDFFSLGGNSMLLLGLHVFVTQEFDVGVSIPDLIENPVFSAMVELIFGAGPATLASNNAI